LHPAVLVAHAHIIAEVFELVRQGCSDNDVLIAHARHDVVQIGLILKFTRRQRFGCRAKH
jgi:hypothetical protein